MLGTTANRLENRVFPSGLAEEVRVELTEDVKDAFLRI